MAVRNLSISFKLQDEVSPKLSQIASNARSTASQLQQMGQQIDRAFHIDSPGQLARTIGDAANEAGARLEELVEAAQELGANLGDVNGGEELSELVRVANEASERLEELIEAAQHLEDNLDDLDDGSLDDLEEDAGNAGDAMEDASNQAGSFAGALKTLFAVVTGAMVLGKIKNFASESIELGKNFTSVMSGVEAISGASASSIEQMEQTARAYGATTVFSASEAAEALKYMSLAGWDANQSSSALGGVLNLAAASGMGLGQASDMVTDYLSAFGMEASQASYFADMLSFAQANSNTTAEALGEAYRNSAASMHAAGQDVETTTSLLEAMANQGYKGSEAGTALAAVMRDITQKMKDGSIQIGETSVAVQDEHGNFRDLTDILTEVEAATSSMGGAQKAAALGTTFTADSLKAINFAFAEGMDKITGYEEALRHADGTAERMAETMNDNLSGDMASMNSAYEEMKLQVFEQLEEPLRDGTQYITNTMIPILTDWVPDAFGALADGVGKLGTALKPLLETVLKNPQAIAGAFSSLGAGFVAMKGVSGALDLGKKISNGVAQAGSLGGALAKLATSVFGNPWAAGAAAIAAAVTGIGFAIHSYNQMKIKNNLEEHFGNIKLSETQIQEVAGGILHADWMVEIHAALGHFENADNLAKEAEAALAANDALEWKARIGMELTEEDKSSFAANIDTFTQASLNELTERTYAAELSVRTILTNPTGEGLADKINQWAKEDLQELSVLKNQMTNLVQIALEDGIIDVEEQAAIDYLQGKINQILAGWKEAEAQAQMDLISMGYGNLSGKDLTVDTFTSLIDALGEKRKTDAEELEADLMETLGTINGLVNSGRITEDKGEDYKQSLSYAARNKRAASLAESLAFETNTLSDQDTYGSKVLKNTNSVWKTSRSYIKTALEDFQVSAGEDVSKIDFTGMYNTLSAGISEALNFENDEEQGALASLYEHMKPDVLAMEATLDEYIKDGQQVPEQVANQYKEAIKAGAAAGDVDAAWAVFAKQMVADPVDKEMVQAIQDGTSEVPEELRTAVNRAVATSAEHVTDKPIGIEEVETEIEGVKVDDVKVQELLDRAMEGVDYTGETITLENGVAAVFEVTAGQSLSEIAEQAGITLDELLAANPEITNPNEIIIGQKINIPLEKVEVDASEVGEAADEAHQEAQKAADEATSEPVQSEQKVEVYTTKEFIEKDNSTVEETLAQEETKTVEQAVSVKYEVADINIDNSALTAAVQTSINESTTQLSYEAVTSAIGTGISSAIDAAFGTIQQAVSSLYHRVGTAIAHAFSAGFHTSTEVVLTANYKLANPTANISFSGGGTGSATVNATLHAEGGYFDQPHLGIVGEAGGEYIIPMNGSDRSKEMWADAGRMLGLETQKSSYLQPVTAMQQVPQPVGGSAFQEKTINVNLNGRGSMKISSSGMSKEQVVEVMLEQMREVVTSIIQQEILEEGEGQYEF